MVILVMRSRRPRRWAGVAFFASVLASMWWAEQRSVAAIEPVAMDTGTEAAFPWEDGSTPWFVMRLHADEDTTPWTDPHRAQFTAFAPSSSTSTDGAMPTK